MKWQLHFSIEDSEQLEDEIMEKEVVLLRNMSLYGMDRFVG